MLAPSPVFAPGLRALAGAYDVLLCDVWGVLHDGVRSFPAAVEALARFKGQGGAAVLISNSPRPAHDVVAQLRALGVPDASWSAFVTSGDVTRALLAERTGRRAFAIGPARDAIIYANLGLAFAGPEEADFISCTGLMDDEHEAPEDYLPALTTAARRGLEMICANPDLKVQRGERLIWCAGALADLYARLGGRVLMAGKPFAPIYDAALSAADKALGRPAPKARVLAVGDGVLTDVLGAQAAGLDCLYIASGVHAADGADATGALTPEAVERMLEAAGARARYALAALAW
jgi:HAD superfamily hydrolase (TIGR01459 family)